SCDAATAALLVPSEVGGVVSSTNQPSGVSLSLAATVPLSTVSSARADAGPSARRNEAMTATTSERERTRDLRIDLTLPHPRKPRRVRRASLPTGAGARLPSTYQSAEPAQSILMITPRRMNWFTRHRRPARD